MRIGEEVFLKEEIDELTILSKGNNLCECTFKTSNNNIHTVTFSNEILEYNNGDPVDDYSTDETEEEEEKVYLKEGIDELTIISIENELCRCTFKTEDNKVYEVTFSIDLLERDEGTTFGKSWGGPNGDGEVFTI